MLRSLATLATLALLAVPNVDAQAPAATPAAALRDLPLVVLAPVATARPTRTAADSTLAIMVTGDGDWAELTAGVADALRASGMGVVGLKARSYLQGKDRTPDGTARDIERIARYYGAQWGRPRLVLVGYSRGADMLPFLATRLAPDVRAHLSLVAMYGLARAASFHFYWTDMVTDRQRPTDLPVAPELARLRGVPMLCVYGSDEKDSGCRDADPALVTRIERSGAHHFDKDYAALGGLVVRAVVGH